ncbi:hypothetical protein KQI10_11035 [Pseudoflavonifractor sp. MSJ-30]|uniref:hypothetical protein n=1 Tax=Pseudoflavonifractor sp. MSJ-30 TaxID=2841525 RepID=UPI001C126653|nr:hypothetical protein [Pseudoflavonifractor sp. MSJ-30]MBU5453695.1 hypothetical protein [Pseudoflavonifractor sp. MSJ-30]
MKIRGFIIGAIGVVALLLPELLDVFLRNQQEDETALGRKKRIIGIVLLFIGLFVAAVDNL